jgi:hypothetical protein
MGYDVLFYNILTVNTNPNVTTAQLNNVVDTYPNLLPGGGSAVFNGLTDISTNSPSDIQNPDSSGACRRVRDGSVRGETRLHRRLRAWRGSRQSGGSDSSRPLSSTRPAIPSEARRVFPQFNARTLIPAYVGPGGNDVEATSKYHGAYLSVSKRLANGLQFGASYTRSQFKSNNDAST